MTEKKYRIPDTRPFTHEDIDLLSKPDNGLDERVEGLKAMRDFINPRMSMATFYARHRPHMDYILFVDRDHWRHKAPRFFTTRRLLYHYMLDRREV